MSRSQRMKNKLRTQGNQQFVDRYQQECRQTRQYSHEEFVNREISREELEDLIQKARRKAKRGEF